MSNTIVPINRNQDSEFIIALNDTVPVAMGYIPLGIAYGILLVNANIDWYWAPIMSLIIFAGALQFISVSFLAAGMPLWEVALTTLIINFRHVFYGLSYPNNKTNNRFSKIYGIFSLTDETYSLIANKSHNDLSDKLIFYIQILSHSYWVLGSLLGALLSQFIPKSIVGIEFALTALFIVLAQEHFYKKDNFTSIGLALISAILALTISSTQFISIAMTLFVISLFIIQRIKAND